MPLHRKEKGFNLRRGVYIPSKEGKEGLENIGRGKRDVLSITILSFPGWGPVVQPEEQRARGGSD